MNIGKIGRFLGIITVAGVFLVAGIQTAHSKNNGKGVRDAADGFYKALNVVLTGDAGPMASVWSHAGDVTYLGPQGGILVGWDNVFKAWQEQAALKLGGSVEPQDMQVTVGGNIGITENYELGTIMVDGKPQTLKIRATNIFRKEGGKWKTIGHHTDLIPSMSSGMNKN